MQARELPLARGLDVLSVCAYSMAMSALTHTELQSLDRALPQGTDRDYTLHWHSAFGVIIIEVKNGEVYVKGDRVQRVDQKD